jgi:outer membrane protein assembly factor BamB
VAAVLVVALGGCDWGMPRGDAARTGSVGEDVLGVGNVAGLDEAWTVATGPAAGPVTAAGAVVVVDGDSVQAYEVASGALRWDTPLPPYPYPEVGLRDWTGPSARGESVYVGYADPLTSGGARGGMVGFDARTGVESDGPGCCGRLAPRSAASFDDGSTWYAGASATPMPTQVWAGIEGLLADRRVVLALTAVGGTGQAAGAPAVSGGRAYFSRPGGGAIDAVDARGSESCNDYVEFVQCTPLWSAPVTGSAEVAASAGALYASTGDGIAAYAAGPDVRGDGQVPLWRADVADAGAVALTPAADATSVLVGAADGTLRSYAAAGCGAPTCTPTWQATTGGALTNPVVAKGVAYVGSADGHVHAFAAAGCGAATCAPLWSAATPGAPRQVIVANSRVFVTTATGHLVAYALP